MNRQLKEQFFEIILALEPERLYQDGERSHVAAEKERKRLLKKWKQLEETYGKKVSFEEMESALWREI